ncbi:MAG TPA: TIM-barrel domain-containing protein [Thermoleophilaceae bacterium]
MKALALAALLLALAATPAAAATQTIDAGPLTVRVTDEPFAIELVDDADGDVLRTVAAPTAPPTDRAARYGALSFAFDLRQPIVSNAYFGYYVAAEAETVWFHPTRVESSSADVNGMHMLLATDDPLGHRIDLIVEPLPSGNARLKAYVRGPLEERVSAFGAGFQHADGERYLGFGERSNAVDQTGQRVISWAEEGPFSAGNYEDELGVILPGFVFPTGPTTTNFPIPWMVSTRGLGVLIENTQRSYFNLRSERDDAWLAEVESPRLDLVVFAGPRPADVVRRYSDHAGGRQPKPPPWIFGPWFQPTLEKEQYELARRFRKDNVPVSVAQTYTHYLPCGVHRGNEGAERERVAAYHRLGLKITTYFNPHVCLEYQPVYDEAARRGLLVKNATGQPYLLSNPFTADEQVSEIDFTHPEGPGFFTGLLDEALAAGYDGWMEDFGEYTPADSVFHNGETGRTMHNRYPVIYHGASTAHSKRRAPAVFIRSGFHGVQPQARVVWGGDPTEDWSCTDGICAAVHQLLSTGLSGIAYQGSDIGGFHAVVNGRTTDELNARWIQVGAISGVMRTQANGYSVRYSREERSQVWHDAVYPIWRRWARLRTRLYPYIAGASAQYQRSAMPIARHLSLAFPEDRTAAGRQRELMFGDWLLAAPVLEPDARERKLYLPPGRWIDLWRSVRYVERDGQLLMGRARVLKGGREATLPAPLDELPLLARAGALIALAPRDVDTLADDLHAPGVVSLGDRSRTRELLAFPRGRSEAWFDGDERLVSRESRGRWTLEVRGKRTRTWGLAASLATLERPFRPCSVRVDGEPLRKWRWLAKERVLRAMVKLRSGRIDVRACR